MKILYCVLVNTQVFNVVIVSAYWGGYERKLKWEIDFLYVNEQFSFP